MAVSSVAMRNEGGGDGGSESGLGPGQREVPGAVTGSSLEGVTCTERSWQSSEDAGGVWSVAADSCQETRGGNY